MTAIIFLSLLYFSHVSYLPEKICHTRKRVISCGETIGTNKSNSVVTPSTSQGEKLIFQEFIILYDSFT